MRSIYLNIRTACAEPDNRAAREAMMLAATQGGIAFCQCLGDLDSWHESAGGRLFHVPHGLSNAMLLPEVTAWSVGPCARCAMLAGRAGDGSGRKR